MHDAPPTARRRIRRLNAEIDGLRRELATCNASWRARVARLMADVGVAGEVLADGRFQVPPRHSNPYTAARTQALLTPLPAVHAGVVLTGARNNVARRPRGALSLASLRSRCD